MKALRAFSLFAASFLSLTLIGQYIPPNRYNLPYKKSHGFVENKGQVVDTDGTLRPDIKFYSEGGFPELFMCKDSWMSFAIPIIDTIPTTQDTIQCLKMHPVGELAAPRDPLYFLERDITQNFYFPWTGSTGATNVRSYARILYQNIYPFIDMHFFSAGLGQRIAFVVRPGGNPANLQLEFDGQDSLSTDAWGNIKFYLRQRHIDLREAQAYQVGSGNTIIPLSWSATYDANNGTGVVAFDFQSYDPLLPLVFEIGPPALGGGPYDEPGMCWSTYFGGNSYGLIQESAVDPDDNYYIAGNTASGFLTFPTAPGNNIFLGGSAAYVCQFSTVDVVTWKTFFGVGGGETIDASGLVFRDDAYDGFPSIYLAGTTNSTQLFTLDFQTAYSNTTNSSATNKGYIARFEITPGVYGLLKWAAYLGDENVRVTGLANGGDDKRYLTGTTQGSLPPELDPPPLTAEHFTYSGALDGFVIMLDDKDRTQWVTPFGGAGDDRPAEIRVIDGTYAKVVIAGTTDSPTMQTLNPGGGAEYHVANLDNDDVMLFDFTLDGQRNWATFWGGQASENVLWNALAVDPATGDVAIGGNSSGFLSIVTGPGWYQGTLSGAGAYLARFSGSDRSCSFTSYVNTSSTGICGITTLLFDDIGNLFVGGWVREDGMDTRALAGTYYQPDIFTDDGTFAENHDCFFFSLTPDHYLPWWSYLGGNGNSDFNEYVFTMLKRHGNLYVAGFTSKQSTALTSYFPLDEANGIPYFTDDVQGALETGYIAAICANVLTGVENDEGVPSDLNAWDNGHGEIIISGLPPDPAEVMIYDMLGQIVQTQRVRSGSGQATISWRNANAIGMYVLHVPGLGAVRLVVR